MSFIENVVKKNKNTLKLSTVGICLLKAKYHVSDGLSGYFPVSRFHFPSL